MHELPWVQVQRQSDSMVLEMRTFMAGGAEIKVIVVRNGYHTHFYQWF